MKTEPMDWEAAITAIRDSAATSATLSNRIVAGVAETLHRQRSLSSSQQDTAKALERIEDRLSSLAGEIAASRSLTARQQHPSQRSRWPILALCGLIAAVVACAVSGWS